MSLIAAPSQDRRPLTPLSTESRLRLLKTVRSALRLMEYYEGMAEPSAQVRAVLLSRLFEAVAQLDALGGDEHARDGIGAEVEADRPSQAN